jgi:hypothetical protein
MTKRRREKKQLMAKNEPVVLELASLPRDQAGPFLLLGLDKTADKEKMESNWADRVRRARKGHLKVALEEVNWARNMLADVEGRLRADSASLNVELSDGLLARLATRFAVDGDRGEIRWQPLERDWPVPDYVPPLAAPDVREIASSVDLPEVTDDLPAVRALLEALAAAPLDPWALDLPDPGRPEPDPAEDLSR